MVCADGHAEGRLSTQANQKLPAHFGPETAHLKCAAFRPFATRQPQYQSMRRWVLEGDGSITMLARER